MKINVFTISIRDVAERKIENKMANRVGSDETARTTVLSGSTLFAKPFFSGL